jgi:hypothetical protein
MWSWLPQKKRRVSVSHRLTLLALVLVVLAKPEDWQGSRSGEGSRVLDEQRWWYECTFDGCHNIKKFDEKQTVEPPYCSRHPVDVSMTLIHRPGEG